MSAAQTFTALHALAASHGSASSAASSQSASTVSVTSLLLQLVIGLGVVLGVIWVVARLLRGKAGLAMGARRQGALAVLHRQSLGKGSSVAIVRAAGRVYLVGVTQQNVHRIDELDAAAPELSTGDPGAGTSDQNLDGGNGMAAAFPTTTQRPTTTWTSTIEQLRELTVRRS